MEPDQGHTDVGPGGRTTGEAFPFQNTEML